MSTAHAATRHRRSLPAAALVGAAVAAALAGVAAFALAGGDQQPAPAAAPEPSAAPAPAASSTRLQTSFGAVSVDSVVRLVGSERPMGVPVRDGELALQITATVTNLRDEPYRVPASLFDLRGAARGGIDAGSRPDFRVPALTAHRFVLRYAVTDGVLLPDLVVRDPAGDAMRVSLGRADDLSTLNVATHKFGDSAR